MALPTRKSKKHLKLEQIWRQRKPKFWGHHDSAPLAKKNNRSTIEKKIKMVIFCAESWKQIFGLPPNEHKKIITKLKIKIDIIYY